MSKKITPFLWYDNNAEEAMNFYISIFNGRGSTKSKVIETSRYPAGGPMPAGLLMTATFEIEGQRLVAMNGGPMFKFTEAISLSVDCKNQEEVDYFWEKLSEGGLKSQCGWLKDKFGLSWQIVPRALPKLLSNPDPVKAGKVMAAMMQMTKIDIKELKKAARRK